MLPIKDDVPSRTFPAVTVLLIVVNVIVFIWEISHGRVGLAQVAQAYGFVPGSLTAYGSGVLGVYLIPLFFFLQFIELPAPVVLGFWLVLQFLNGAASALFRSTTGGVAWWAHMGGFLGGILVFNLFRPRPKLRYSRGPYEYFD
jgi:membrane associated rhomboid family serine protease